MMSGSGPGMVTGGVRTVLRVEGLAILAFMTLAYAYVAPSWWLYALLFFVPDVAFAAYLAGPRLGAAVYDALHSFIGPAFVGFFGFDYDNDLMLALTGVLLDDDTLLAVAAVWAAHIGFDRALGYGLKYASAFGDTHLGRIGRAK